MNKIQENLIYAKNQERLFAFGFSHWKRNYIRQFLYAPSNEIIFVNCKKSALKRGFDKDCRIVIWGEKAISEAENLSQSFNIPIWRIEDGFIRSIGLGSDYTPPLSLVLDKRGIYYNPKNTSDLEYILQTTHFSKKLLHRAAILRVKLIEYNLSKYNLGGQLKQQIKVRENQSLILVPGQVEDDISILKGCLDIANNKDLLLATRAANPDAYVIYKPHPDVVSGNRKGSVDLALLEETCNLVLDDISVTDCIDAVDEVHTMTSLVGFEALLRNKKVYCYGLPFYAGWGLTKDRHVIRRRRRNLTLDQLVAATLILYPRYIDYRSRSFTTPEIILEILKEKIIKQGGKNKNKMHNLKRFWVKLTNIFHAVYSFLHVPRKH